MAGGGASDTTATTPTSPTSATIATENSVTPRSRGSANRSANSTSASGAATAAASTLGVRPKPTETALPPGWDFSYSDKGRMFFIDHVNKITSWIDPRTGKPSPTPNLDFESRIGPLPVNFNKKNEKKNFFLFNIIIITISLDGKRDVT